VTELPEAEYAAAEGEVMTAGSTIAAVRATRTAPGSG